MHIIDILKKGIELGTSDCYLMVGAPISYKVKGKLKMPFEGNLTNKFMKEKINELYEIEGKRPRAVFETGDDDFAIKIEDLSRFRVNVFQQKDTFAAVVRTIPLGTPDPAKFNIPNAILQLTKMMRGMVLVTGTTGSGKSTTLACLIDIINTSRDGHIITIEDPLEFVHTHKKSRMSQREIQRDTESYAKALRAAMRQAPDVILIGEMRDPETIAAAITAAETGHLVFSTLHTMGAAPTIDRIIDVFPAAQQNQVRTQLASSIQAVVCQQLIPTRDGKLHPAFEIMISTPAIKANIREAKTFQIPGIMQVSSNLGMRTMDMDLYNLFKKGVITKENALTYCIDVGSMTTRLGGGQ